MIKLDKDRNVTQEYLDYVSSLDRKDLETFYIGADLLVDRLNNIINEFNEFIEEVYNHINLGDESDEFMLVFDKWRELKGVDKE